jgi:hypothetical protein
MKPETVPDKISDPINKKVLLMILVTAVSFQAFITIMPNSGELNIFIALVSILNPLITSIMAFVVSLRYGHSQVFGKAYFSLGVGLFMMFLGETTWYYFLYFLEIEPFPSIADVFFFAFYPLSAIHIMINVRFFKTKIDIKSKAILIALPLIIIATYSIITLNEIGEPNFEFYYGMSFVIASSIVLALALLGSLVFRGGVLGIAWTLMLLGLLLTNTGDVWFFYLETFGAYTDGHPVELLWYGGYWVITYGLYKHKKII